MNFSTTTVTDLSLTPAISVVRGGYRGGPLAAVDPSLTKGLDISVANCSEEQPARAAATKSA